MTKIRITRWLAGLGLAAAVAVSVRAQGPLTPIMQLRGVTDSNGYLMVIGAATSGAQTPLTPIANLMGRTDANGYLYVAIGSGTITPDKICIDATNQDTCLQRVSAGVFEVTNGTSGTYRDLMLRDLTASRAIQTTMAQPSTLAATPSQLGTDLAAGVYTITVTALDVGGGQTDDPTAITCTVAAGGAGRCALTWDAVPGAVSYRAWTSLVGVATPTRYFAAYTNAYNLDTLTGATVATLPTAGTAYVVYFSPTGDSWLGGPLFIEKNAIGTTTTKGFDLVNNTAAAAGTQQYPPANCLKGFGWKTNATAGSQAVETCLELRPVQGAAAPTYNHVLMGRVNEGSWSDLISTSSVGRTTFLEGIIVTANMEVGAARSIGFSSRSILQSTEDSGIQLSNGAGSAFAHLDYGPAGGATTSVYRQKTISAIADATATAVFTVTIPNAAHSGNVHVRLIGSLGAGGAIGANECSAVLDENVVITRTAGVATVATVSAAGMAASSCVAGATTITMTSDLSAIVGAVGAEQTFTVRVTITKGGGASANHTVMGVAELGNANATGITIS